MTLMDAVGAYRALAQMMKESWNFEFIYPLLKLWRELETDYEYFCGEEIKLVSAYGKKNAEGKVAVAADGSFDFPNLEAGEKYRAAHLELGQRKIPDRPKLSLTPPCFIRGEWVAALAPFCDFEQAGGNSDESA